MERTPVEQQPKHILVVSCLIRNPEGQVLLVKHRKRGWELPQGRVEEGEDLISALHREIHEETGVLVGEQQLTMIWSKVSAPAAKIFCFTARYHSGELTSSEETPAVEWCVPAEAVLRTTHPVNHDRLCTLLAHEGPLQFRSYQTAPYQVLS